MPVSRIVPTPAPADLPTYTISVNGNALAATYRVVSITTAHQAYKIPEANITLLDGDVSIEDFPASNTADLIPGVAIEINAGYHGQEQTIFKGTIVRHAIKILQGQSSLLRIVAKHDVFKLSLQRKTTSFKDSADSEVMEQLLSVPKEVESTGATVEQIIQANVSDWDLINIRAEANAQFVLPRADKIIIQKPKLDAEAVLALQYGSSILEFEAELDVRKSFTEVKVSGWDIADQALIESTASNTWLGMEPGNISGNDAAASIGNAGKDMYLQGASKTEDADRMAKAEMIKHHLNKICGRVRCIGFASVWPGDMIELIGVGARFVGKAYVTGVQHSIREGRWDTDIQFGWKYKHYTQQYEDISPIAASGAMPPLKGLQLGVVAQLEDDPKGESRVLVKMPTQSGDSEALWARMSLLDAGQERGTFFRPEIGDEVVIGFLDEHPLSPIILGALHSSKLPPPIAPADDNHLKGIYSRSPLRFLMDDDKKEITIDTPAGNKMVLSEDQTSITIEDQNGNKLVMNEDGIEMTSAKDIKLKATGDILLEGINIEETASAQYKASGSSGAEFSSSAVAILKGSLVQIN